MAANRPRTIPIPPHCIPLPEPLCGLLNQVSVRERHPGLQLDKYIRPCPQQEQQKEELARVIEASQGFGVTHGRRLLQELQPRRTATLTATGANTWTRVTAGPLTLGLARASALENAGLTLHAIYGFPYLPGSGLKGLARSYAETIWLAGQDDPASAWETIERVFGWAPGSDQVGKGQEKPWKPKEVRPHPKEASARAGAVVFHDAWPTSWPRLVIDIVNNHHPSYYQENKPPGDWDSPVPVYFLAIEPGQEFEFAIGPGPAATDDGDALRALARQWLDGALTHLGSGAKTAAGYGYWNEPEPGGHADAIRAVWKQSRQAASDPSHEGPGVPRLDVETTLELISPAFLAGAEQQEDDCDLRPATLRGLLRWWWRTMHVGFLDRADLAALEAALWGDTKQGGAIQLSISQTNLRSKPTLYDRCAKANMNPREKRSERGIEGCDPQKTTQGLWYLSFGMDNDVKDRATTETYRRQRYVIEPGATWTVHISARHATFRDRHRAFTPRQVLDQARAALWLLCRFGGVGSKARKGFGSLMVQGLDGIDFGTCQRLAADVRSQMGVEPPAEPREDLSSSSSLFLMLDPVEQPFGWPDVWDVLDQVGFAYQAFAQQYKHRLEKRALGLPRKLRRPIHGQFQPTGPVADAIRKAKQAGKPDEVRYASPVHIHVDRDEQGRFIVRVVAFPSKYLPNLGSSRAFLTEFLKHMKQELTRRSQLPKPQQTRGSRSVPERGPRRSGPVAFHGRGGGKPMRGRDRQASAPVSVGGVKANDRVQARLLDETTKSGKRKAIHEPTGLKGHIQNSDELPADKQVGDVVELMVASINQREVTFRVG